MSDIALSREEIENLSGYQRPSKQIAWLRKHGIRFMVAADGYPRVLRREVESAENQPLRTPNLEALRRLS